MSWKSGVIGVVEVARTVVAGAVTASKVCAAGAVSASNGADLG
jgi:hypothetical protein